MGCAISVVLSPTWYLVCGPLTRRLSVNGGFSRWANGIRRGLAMMLRSEGGSYEHFRVQNPVYAPSVTLRRRRESSLVKWRSDASQLSMRVGVNRGEV